MLLFRYKPYFSDPESLQSATKGCRRGKSNDNTIGNYVQQLASETRYNGSILPRIPTIHLQALREAMKESRHNTVPSQDSTDRSRSEQTLRIGTKVKGLFSEDGKWYRGVIDAIDKATGKYWVLYDAPYENTELLEYVYLF